MLCRRSHLGASILALAAVLLGTLAAGAAQPATSAPRSASASKKVLHLRIRGDLDCSRLVVDVATELRRARAEGAEMLLLELDGDRWRADVVWGIAREIRAMRVPAAAWLVDGRERRIGSGQAVLALLATTQPESAGQEADAPLPPASIFMDPRSVIASEPGDDLRGDAPEGTDWEVIDRELQGAAWSALRSRRVDTELAAALLSPTEELWAVVEPGSARPRLTMTRPPLDAAATPVVERASAMGAAAVRLDAALAAHLGLSAGSARTPGDVLSALRVTAAPRTMREVASGLAKARSKVESTLAGIDMALERADRLMGDLPRRSAADYESKRERAGKAALPLLDEAAAAIVLAEELIAEYPELLRSNPPSRTPVGQDPQWYRNAWRVMFQQKRDEYGRLAARAREYAGQ